MPPKARSNPAKGAIPPATPTPLAAFTASTAKDSADPMLQGNYEHDDDGDFDPSTDAIAAFEARLTQQQQQMTSSGGRSTSLLAIQAPARNRRMPLKQDSQSRLQSNVQAEDQRRLSAVARGAAAHRTPPLSAQPLATSSTPPFTAVPHREADRRLSEEEQAAQVQRGEDVEEVRLLEARFGGQANDDGGDSDDGSVAVRRKVGL